MEKRKEGRTAGRKNGRKEGRADGRNEERNDPGREFGELLADLLEKGDKKTARQTEADRQTEGNKRDACDDGTNLGESSVSFWPTSLRKATATSTESSVGLARRSVRISRANSS